MGKMPKQKPGESIQNFSTPMDFILAVEKRFGKISFDLAASSNNTKASNYFDIRENSLDQDWYMLKGNLWLNPPFARIHLWSEKCLQTAANLSPNSRILLLTPASTGSNWFQEHVWGHASVLALSPRLCFDGIGPYPKDCILSVFTRKGVNTAEFECWRWK